MHVALWSTDKVDVISSRLERSKTWIVKQALGAWIELEEERRRLTLAAMVDVDNNDVLDHQTAQAWAESLSTDSNISNIAEKTPWSERSDVAE